MAKKILVNSRTSGKVSEITIDGRAHLSTVMIPIVGNITMNGIFYPDDQVTNSFTQLDMMPAPNGHPKVNGINTSAFHPVANNKHNIGGFIRNARKKGVRVFCEFCLDLTVANSTDAGKSLVARMKEGKKIGVSTGLAIATITNEAGTDSHGVAYTRKGAGYTFDHVAILMNEAAAGEHAGTELVLNESGEDIEVANLITNELSTDDIYSQLNDLVRANDSDESHTWVREVFPESKTLIFSFSDSKSRQLFFQSYAIDANDVISLLDDKVEVIEKKEYIKQPSPTFNSKEKPIMEKQALALAIIANASNKYNAGDNAILLAMDDAQLTAIISANPLTVENAKATLKSEFDFEGYAGFVANKADFEAFQAEKNTKLNELRGKITAANAAYTPALLAGKDIAELNVINEMIAGQKQSVRIPQGQAPMQHNSAETGASQISYE